MIPAWWALKALPWLKGNWQYVSLVAAGLFCVLWIRGCGQLTACQAASGKQTTELTHAAQQKQELEGKLEIASKAKAKVVYVHVPGQPCPEVHVEVEADGGATAAGKGSQAQDMSATAKVNPASGWKSGGLRAGLLYFKGPMLTMDLEQGPYMLGGMINEKGEWGAKTSYRVLEW